MNRRDFLFDTCNACLAAVGTSALLSSCAFTRYVNGTIAKDGVTVTANEFQTKKRGKPSYRSFIIIRNEALKYPIYLYRFTDTEYAASWMACTHQGSELQASGDHLQCPAHGSEFNNRGKLISGPAVNDLRTFPVTVNNNEIFIDLRAV